MAIISNSKKDKKINSTSSNKAPAGNTLDSTAPSIKRGKEREKPKKKRPSKMRKIIAAERAARLMSQEFDIEKPTIVPEDIDTEAKNNDNNITVEEFTVGVNEEKPLTSTAEVRVFGRTVAQGIFKMAISPL